MKIGYARVSTKNQDLSLQLDALEKIGCQKIYQEKITGSTRNRTERKKSVRWTLLAKVPAGALAKYKRCFDRLSMTS